MPSRWKAHFDLTLISHSAHNTRPCHSVNYELPWLNCRVSTTWLFVLPICTLRCAGALYCRLCPVLYSSFYSLALIINVPFVYKRSSCFYHKSILCFSLYVLKQACKQKIISSSSCSAQKFMIMWARHLVTSGKEVSGSTGVPSFFSVVWFSGQTITCYECYFTVIYFEVISIWATTYFLMVHANMLLNNFYISLPHCQFCL